MSFNEFLRGVAVAAFLYIGLCGRAEEPVGEPAFREELFFSEYDRDGRTPQAVRVGGVVFVSAISGPGETVEQQARVAYMRLQSILGNYGMNMADVAQERIYLKEGADASGLSELRPLYYGQAAGPASTMVRVAGFEGEGRLIAIELIAVADPESD